MTYEEYFKHWDEVTDKAIACNLVVSPEIYDMLTEQSKLDEKYPEYKARLDKWIAEKAAEHDAAKQSA